MGLNIRILEQSDIPTIVAAFTSIGWNKPASLYEGYLREQEAGMRCVWIALQEKEFAGYVTLKKTSDYSPFREHNIPEISDLNVLPLFRNQGIGTALLHQAETEAKKTSPIVGIGMGLTAEYGPAQKLYIRQGYVPDGLGVTSHANPLIYGAEIRVDDDLVLWLTKKLSH
jgi:ribosomal protein S18 acetylase RimI-like enzyme